MLFSCRPGFGHFHPLVALATALTEARHDVRFASAPDFVDAIRKQGFDADPIGLTDAEQIRRRHHEIPELLTAPAERMRSLMFPHAFAGFEVPPRVEDLLPILRRWRPDLLIHEMAEFAAPLAGALEAVPTVNHSWGPLVAPDVMAAAGDCAGEHWRAMGLPAPDQGGMYDGLYLDVCPPLLQERHLATIPNVQTMRPVPVPSAHEATAPWLAELGDKPVVTVTFGTVFNKRIGADLYRWICDGLAEIDADVILALGPGVPVDSVGPLPRNVRAFPWVPWTPLLAKTAVVVGHGGASSSLGPLSHGIPLVVLPLGADHFVNAARILAAGAGIRLDPAARDLPALRKSVERALSPPLRRAAQRVAEEIAQMPAPADVVPRLERYAQRRTT